MNSAEANLATADAPRCIIRMQHESFKLITLKYEPAVSSPRSLCFSSDTRTNTHCYDSFVRRLSPNEPNEG